METRHNKKQKEKTSQEMQQVKYDGLYVGKMISQLVQLLKGQHCNISTKARLVSSVLAREKS